MSKILVIEDDPFIRDSLIEILLAEDFQAIPAKNGSIGVHVAHEIIPDLIICDILMPEMDGYQVLHQLRCNPVTATIPFIFLTARAYKEDVRQGMEMGADDYLTKPFTRYELMGAIYSRLEKQAAINKQTQKKLDDLRQSIAISLPQELLVPLNSISSLSKIILENYQLAQSSEIGEIAQQIFVDSQRLHRLIHNFLLYAELEIAASEPEKFKALRSRRSIYSKTVISEAALQKIKEYSRESDLHFDLQEASIQISKADLQKIVEEIVDNACKFSPTGTPIQINSTLEKNTFTLQAIDRGRGMTKEQISELGAYIQFDRKLYEQQGSGLGLSIVKRIVQIYGGEMIVKSIPKKQTIVRLIFQSGA